MVGRVCRTILFFIVLCGVAVAANAQQTGSISGKVSDSSGAVLPGVTVEARSGGMTAVLYQLPFAYMKKSSPGFTLLSMAERSKPHVPYCGWPLSA